MADSVTSKVLLEGPRNLVMRFTNVSDGTGESAVTKVDMSTLAGVGHDQAVGSLKIVAVDWKTTGMGVNILWDATADVLALTLPPDTEGQHCYRHFGGVQNTAGTGVTGDIVFTTIGASAGNAYDITLTLAKKS